jgi:HSP20 family protein
MAIIRRTGGGESVPSLRSEFDPFRVMQDLLRWDPFRGSGAWERAIQPFTREAGFAPDFEVKETKDHYVFKADLPGVKDADLDISLTGNMLTISGKREAEHKEESDTFYAYERSFGNFTRSFALPEAADSDNVKAELKDGVLTIWLHKKAEMQPKKIAVKATTDGGKAKA